MSIHTVFYIYIYINTLIPNIFDKYKSEGSNSLLTKKLYRISVQNALKFSKVSNRFLYHFY